MWSQEIPQFEGRLENLNNFFALPGFWQPIVLAYFRTFIEEEYIKTRSELIELKDKWQKLPPETSEADQWKAAKPWSEAMRVSGFFSQAVTDALAGTTNLGLRELVDDINAERRERFEELLRTPEHEYLGNFLSDIDIESRDELRTAWLILDLYVSTRSEENRDEIAQQRRQSK